MTKKIEPYTALWERHANALARSWIRIRPCREYNEPVNYGYCCTFCGSNNP